MAAIPETEVAQLHCQTTKSTAHLRLKSSGKIDLQIIKSSTPQRPLQDTVNIAATATECSWNVYSTAKLPKSTQVSNRAQLVESTSDGQTFRIGSAIFLPQSSSSSDTPRSFTVPKMSLYIDSIEQHGRHLFVTSRQDITTVPEPKDEPVKATEAKPTDADSKSKDAERSTEKSGVVGAESSTATKDAATKDKPTEETADSSDDDDPSDMIPQPSDDDSSNELSADESWSEGSTDYDSDQRLREFNPRMPQQEKVKTNSNFESTDLESNNEGAASDDSDQEEDLLEGSDQEGAAMSSDEEDRWFDIIFDEPNHPQYDEEDERSEVGEEEDDYPDFGDWNHEDWNQPIGSDSEDCSECGDDGGACVMPPKDITAAAKTEVEEEAEEAVGTPAAHIYVYDTSASGNDQDGPKRIFHFKRATGQTLAASPPAIHPTKSLVVLPLGDGKILFADYESNTYFVRKFPTSQSWSSHVSINCHFSSDGKHLRVVALEKLGRPPTLPTRKSKAKKKDKEETPKPKKEIPKYELIVSTYRMSNSKTTRAPPTLTKRVQKDLGELDVLPIISWNDDRVYISFTKKTTAFTYRVDLQAQPATKMRPAKEDKMVMRCFAVDLPEWVTNREVQFIPAAGDLKEGQLVVMPEPTKIPPYKSAPTEDSTSSTEVTISEKAPTVTPPVEGSSIVSKTEGVEVNGSEQDYSKGEAPTDTSVATDSKALNNGTEDTQKEQEPPKSIHPGMLIAYVSEDDIKASGGWRDVHEAATTESKGDEKNAVAKVELNFEEVGGDA